MGGFRYLRSELGELEDEIEVLQKRLSRREQSARQDQVRGSPKVDINEEVRELLLMRALGQAQPVAATPPVPATREQMAGQVRKIFRDGDD